MRSAVLVALLTAGCSGPAIAPGVMDAGAPTVRDAATDAVSPVPPGTCPNFAASNFDQSCNTDSDCVAIGSGDVCLEPCLAVCGIGGTINVAALPAYQRALAGIGYDPAGLQCGCCRMYEPPCCMAGVCTIGALCPGPRQGNCPDGEVLCPAGGCVDAVACGKLPCPAPPPAL